MIEPLDEVYKRVKYSKGGKKKGEILLDLSIYLYSQEVAVVYLYNHQK